MSLHLTLPREVRRVLALGADERFELPTFRLWAWQATTAPIRDNAFVDFTSWKSTKYGKFSRYYFQTSRDRVYNLGYAMVCQPQLHNIYYSMVRFPLCKRCNKPLRCRRRTTNSFNANKFAKYVSFIQYVLFIPHFSLLSSIRPLWRVQVSLLYMGVEIFN